MQKILVSVLLLAVLVQSGMALQCYECSEIMKGGEVCKDPFKGGATKTTCPGNAICAKQVTPEITIGNVKVPPAVSRGCGAPNVCETPLKDVSGHCSTCSTELCNSSSVLIPSFTIIALVIAKCLYL